MSDDEDHNVTATHIADLAFSIIQKIAVDVNQWRAERPNDAGAVVESLCAFLVAAMVVHNQALARFSPLMESNPDLMDWCREIYMAFVQGMDATAAAKGKGQQLQMPALPAGVKFDA